MKITNYLKTLICIMALGFTACDDDPEILQEDPTSFKEISEIDLGGEGASEIGAYDPATQLLFVVNNESNSQVDVVDLSDLDAVKSSTSISSSGGVNSVAVKNGLLAIAIENATSKQGNGSVVIYETSNLTTIKQTITVGALPDMVTFSPDGKFIVVANEGEPNDDYDNDPNGSISIISVDNNYSVTTLDFTSFNSQESTLEAQGLRVFGPNASLAADVEPEYIAISADSKTAWVSLQENNGIAKVNLTTKSITDIYPLGFKDYSLAINAINASDRDNDDVTLSAWSNVKGMYQPDAIAVYNVGGTNYIVTANEGDARDYDGFSEEERVKDLDLDPTAFPNATALQADDQLGRLEITTTLGDTDGDGDYDELYSYGARSFSIWNGDNGTLVYDSGNELEKTLLAEKPALYDDGRSDAKGVEPEGIAIGKLGNKTVAFIGLERADAVMVYDITSPSAPVYVKTLEVGDAPEGIAFVPANESPNGRSILIVTSEDDGLVKIFQTDLNL